MRTELTATPLKKNIGLSVVAQGISLLVGFIVNLILPKYISEYQYAVWQTYLLYVGYVGIFHFGLLDGLVLRYSQYDYDELDKTKIRSQFRCLLLLTGFFCLIGIACAILFFQYELKTVFIFVSVGIITRSVLCYTSYSFQITNRIKQYAGMMIGYRGFYGIGVIALLSTGCHQFYGFCVVDILSDLFGVFISVKHNRALYLGRGLKCKETVREAMANISAGIKLLISNWSLLFLTGSARMIIQLHWSELTFGKVSFAFSVTNLFLTFVAAVSIVLFPALKRTPENQLADLYLKIRKLINPFLIAVLIFYYPGCWLLKRWLPSYAESLSYLGILFPIIIYSSKISLLTNNYLKALRKEKDMVLINVFSVVIAVALFSVGAFIRDDLKLLLLFAVFVMMICSVVSETVVMKALCLFRPCRFVFEILATVFFILSVFIPSRFIGLSVYSFFLCVGLIINKTSDKAHPRKTNPF